MGHLLAVVCSGCGYRSGFLVEGSAVAGSFELFACPDCREVVSVLTYSSGLGGAVAEQERKCCACGGRRLTRWREGDESGLCPRCGAEAAIDSIGIAD